MLKKEKKNSIKTSSQSKTSYSIIEQKSYKYQEAMSLSDHIFNHGSYLIVSTERKIE
jgi:hypothetical protein